MFKFLSIDNTPSQQLLPLIQLLCIGSIAYGVTTSLGDYILHQGEMVASLILLLFAIDFDKKVSLSNNWGMVSVLLIGGYLMLHLTSLFYFGAIAMILWFVSRKLGKPNIEFVAILWLSSPFMVYFIKVFGFPIRLMLSKWSALILDTFAFEAISQGNEISVNGHAFQVEPVCMGLHLVLVSWTLSLAMLVIYRKQLAVQSNITHLLLTLALATALVILSNLIRIITLVLFQIPEESMTHQWVGMQAFAVYVVVPLAFIIPFILRNVPIRRIKWLLPQVRTNTLHLMIILAALVHFNPKIPPTSNLSPLQASLAPMDYDIKKLPYNTLQVSNNQMLTYIKLQQNAWTPDHNPTICWTASGYKIQRESMVKWQVHQVASCLLTKDGEVLTSLYWFTDGEQVFSSQWEWRMHMLKCKKPIYLVNIVANDEATLYEEAACVQEVLKESNKCPLS